MTTQYGPPSYSPAPSSTPRNGLGTAGFILGLLALLFAWVPLVGVIGWPLSILGLALSGIGLHRCVKGQATNKGLSLAGLVLSTLALIVCILWATAFGKAVSDGSPTTGTVSGSSASAATPAQSGVLALGQTYTYPDGLAVTISVDKSFDPGTYYPNAARGVTLKVTVHNGTSTNFAVNSIGNGPQVLVDGARGRLITNPAARDAAAGIANATVLPGNDFTYRPSVEVPAGPAELQAEWMRELVGSPVIFTGRG